MPLDSNFWDEPTVHCGTCFTPHNEMLPHQCDCGHTLEQENVKDTTFERVTVGRVGYQARQEIYAIEDARVLAAIEKASHATRP